MFRVWAEGDGWIVNPDGTFIHAIETPEFRRRWSTAQVWATGACHPDSLTQTSNEVREQLMAGTTGSGPNAFILLELDPDRGGQDQPQRRDPGLVPPGHDGGQGVAYNIGGWFGQYCYPVAERPGRGPASRS